MKTGVEESKNISLEQQIENLEQRMEHLEQRNHGLSKELESLIAKHFLLQTKFTIIGIQKHWFTRNSEEYKSLDHETVQELTKKYHLNITEEKIPPNPKMTPYLKIIKFCYENRYLTLYRNEIMGLLKVKKLKAIRIMKKIEEENPVIFKLCQKEKYSKNSMFYLEIKDKERLRQVYTSYF